MITEVMGDLIEEAMKGNLDLIAHGCNCFCTQKSGIAVRMSANFYTDKYELENSEYHSGDVNKLGQIEYRTRIVKDKPLWIVNAYTQFHWSTPGIYGIPLDYDALRLCFRKINKQFRGSKVGLPGLIGCGLASGDPKVVRQVLKEELKSCEVIIYYVDEILKQRHLETT